MFLTWFTYVLIVPTITSVGRFCAGRFVILSNGHKLQKQFNF